MKNQSKELNKLNEENKTIFVELFGFNKKQSQSTGSGQVEKIGVGKYRMGKSIITGIQGTSDSEILNFDFYNSKLKWLLSCEFEGILGLDIKKEECSFAGVWKSGIFKGTSFSNSSKSSFNGGQFGDETMQPRYVPGYETWNVSPSYFYDGTIVNTSGGVLGIKDAVPGIINQPINILSIKPGYSILLKTRSKVPVRGVGGKMQKSPVESIYTLTVLKRIDDKNSNFIFKFKNIQTNQEVTKTISWKAFRDDKTGQSLIFSDKKESIIFTAFGFTLLDKIFTAEIIESGVEHSLQFNPNQGAEKTLATTQEIFDLSKLPYLNIKKLNNRPSNSPTESSAYFYTSTTDYKNKYNEVLKYIENGKLASDLSIISAGIKNGIIDGYGNFKRLSGLFNNIKGVENNDKEYQDELIRLDNFFKYFIELIYMPANNGAVDDETQELIIDRLKTTLRIKTPNPAAPITKSKSSKIVAPPASKVIKEINEVVDKFLLNSLKHF